MPHSNERAPLESLIHRISVNLSLSVSEVQQTFQRLHIQTFADLQDVLECTNAPCDDLVTRRVWYHLCTLNLHTL